MFNRHLTNNISCTEYIENINLRISDEDKLTTHLKQK